MAYKSIRNLGMNQRQLGELVGYSTQQIHNINVSLPDDHKLLIENEGGGYNVQTFVQRWVEYNVNRATSSLDYDLIKAEHEASKKRKTDLQVQQMEGELIPVREVKRLWGNVIDAARKNLLQLSNRVAPRLRMVDSVERIANIIDTEVRGELEQLANTKLPGETESGAEE